MRPLVRYIAVASAGAVGSLVVVALLASPQGGAPTFRGFHAPAAVIDGQNVRWARYYAKVDLPDNGWRPLRVSFQLRSPDEAPSGRTRVTIAVEDVPLRRVEVDTQWRSYDVVVTRSARTGGPLALQLYTETFGSNERGVGVGQVKVRPVLVSTRSALWAAAGGILGALWLGAGYVRREDGALLSVVRRVAPSADSRGIGRALRILPAIVFLGILVGVLGYAELGRRLFSAVMMVPGLEAAGPGIRAMLLAPAALFHVVVLVAILTLPGWFVLSTHPGLRPAGDSRYDAMLAMPVTVMLTGIVLIPLQYTGVPNPGFTAIFFAAYGAMVVTLAASPTRRHEFIQFVRTNRLFFLLQVLVPLCALFYVSVGLQDSGQIADWTWPARRNLHALPADNDLSRLAAVTWRRHLAADALFQGDLWRISDRGPLLAVVHSAVFRALDPVAESFPQYLRLGIVLNGSFAAAIFVLVRQWSSKRVAWGCAALVALNPWFFLNVYYTWPKLFGTYFVLAAIAILWADRRPTLGCFLWAGVLFGLGMLAHAAHVLSFPIFYLFTAVMYVRSSATLRHWLAVPVSLAVTQIPWSAYKRLYSPDTWTLLIQHYLDELHYFKPLSVSFAAFMAKHPWPEQLVVRKHQLATLFWGQLQWVSILGWWRGSWDRDLLLHSLYPVEFFYAFFSAGLLWFPWIAIGAAVNSAFSALRRAFEIRPSIQHALTPFLKAPPATFQLRPAFVALTFAVVSLGLNAFIRWGGPITHALPYVETVLIATVGLYVLRYLGVFYWLMALGAILVRQAQYFGTSAATSPLGLPRWDVNGVLFWMTCAALVVPCFLVKDATEL